MASAVTRSLALIVPLATAGLAWAVTQYAGATPPPEKFAKGFEAINAKDITTWMNYLAGPETEGRGTGQPGYQKAAEWMAKRFAELGLKPGAPDGTFFQNIPFTRQRMADSSSFASADGKVKLQPGTGFLITSAGTVDLSGPVVFVQQGGPQATLADASAVKDSVVILSTPSGRSRLTGQLYEAGAKAVLTVAPKLTYEWTVRRGTPANTSAAPTPAARVTGRVSQEGMKQLMSASNVNLMMPDATQVVVTPTVLTLELKASAQTETVQVPNVVGILPGSDPTLAPQHVGIGAHLDHLGISNGTVYPGADDDASGNAALLAVAQAFQKNPVKPRRSIVFMAFTGEEMGLIGSRYYADNPTLPLDKMVAELQMDMVGRNEQTQTERAEDNVDTIHLVGSKRISTELHDIILEMNKSVGLKFEYDQEDVYTRSDHYAFASKGVPIAFLFSGFHPDYHQPTDTLEKINYDKIVAAAKLFYLVAAEVANRDNPPKKDVVGG